MKLALVLFGVTIVLGYEESYKGFDECGVEGWSCANFRNKYEITYTCSKNRPNARVWIWTARLPKGASTFIVRDCNHLEVHFDCTTGLRTTILNTFKVINVTNLEILPPLLPGVFLHDNDQIPQAPPNFYLSNVKKIKLYPGVFDKPIGGCRFKYIGLATLVMENVHIDRMTKDLFHTQNLDSLMLRNVVIDSIDGNAMTIAANAIITGTTFPFIPSNGIALKGENITFVNNTFKKIQTKGLIIKSKYFRFSDNYVEEINTQGLDVLGAKIEITKNVFDHLETGAFQGITPGYSPITYEIAFKFIYNFSGNIIKNINPGSIHPNWGAYKTVCTDLIFKNNVFECSCMNFGWVSVSNGLGPKISSVKEFYDMYLNKEDNYCSTQERCPLNVVLSQIQDVCNNKTNISTICSSINSSTETVTFTSSDDVTIAVSNTTEEERTYLTEQSEVTEKIIPVLSYTENQTTHMESRGLPVWFIVIPVIVLLAAISTGLFIWWYKKTKQRQIIMTKYRNEKGIDADNLIMINEHPQ